VPITAKLLVKSQIETTEGACKQLAQKAEEVDAAQANRDDVFSGRIAGTRVQGRFYAQTCQALTSLRIPNLDGVIFRN